MKFNELQIIEPILKSVEEQGHVKPTPIQVEAIPAILSKRDLLASAQTGTGKTAAFTIPILQQIYNENLVNPSKAIKALVLTPTRELATQVGEDFFNYSKYLKIRSLVIFGGVAQVKQTQALNRGTTVLVATPGRLLDLINQGFINLSEVEYLVLDEADQMLDMGFIRDVRKIVKFIPAQRQTLLFSATMPNDIIKLSNELLDNPIRIEVTPIHQTLDIITQNLYHVNKNQKLDLLTHVINQENMFSVLVFSRTKHQANKIANALKARKLSAEAIHGNKSQSARERALENFKSGKTQVLVATDIAARGIDIEGLSYVINYDLPEVPETYIHRIGRTGRAGASGVAISFCEPENIRLLRAIEKHLQTSLEVIDEPRYSSKDIKFSTNKDTKENKSNNKPKNNNKRSHKKEENMNKDFEKKEFKTEEKKPYRTSENKSFRNNDKKPVREGSFKKENNDFKYNKEDKKPYRSNNSNSTRDNTFKKDFNKPYEDKRPYNNDRDYINKDRSSNRNDRDFNKKSNDSFEGNKFRNDFENQVPKKKTYGKKNTMKTTNKTSSAIKYEKKLENNTKDKFYSNMKSNKSSGRRNRSK